MPWLGVLPGLPYEQSTEAAMYRLGNALMGLAKVKQQLADQQAQSQLARLLAAGGTSEELRARLLSFAATQAPRARGGVLGQLVSGVNPFAPARGVSGAQRSVLSSLIGQALEGPPQGSLAWRQRYLGETPSEARESVAIAAGRKPRATAAGGGSATEQLRLLQAQRQALMDEMKNDPDLLNTRADIVALSGMFKAGEGGEKRTPWRDPEWSRRLKAAQDQEKELLAPYQRRLTEINQRIANLSTGLSTAPTRAAIQTPAAAPTTRPAQTRPIDIEAAGALAQVLIDRADRKKNPGFWVSYTRPHDSLMSKYQQFVKAMGYQTLTEEQQTDLDGIWDSLATNQDLKRGKVYNRFNPEAAEVKKLRVQLRAKAVKSVGAARVQGQELTEEEARAILLEAGGDKEKARQIARRRGYRF